MDDDDYDDPAMIKKIEEFVGRPCDDYKRRLAFIRERGRRESHKIERNLMTRVSTSKSSNQRWRR